MYNSFVIALLSIFAIAATSIIAVIRFLIIEAHIIAGITPANKSILFSKDISYTYLLSLITACLYRRYLILFGSDENICYVSNEIAELKEHVECKGGRI